jgi:CRP-like cAMP-binding protein
VSDEALHGLIRFKEYVLERGPDQEDFYEMSRGMPETLRKQIALAMHMQVFQKLAVLDNLREHDLAKLEEVALEMKPRIFAPGDFLLKAGRISPVMFFLVEGMIALQRPSGETVQKLDGSAGTIIGEMSLVQGTPEVVSVVACTYLEAFELDKQAFDRIQLRDAWNATGESPAPAVQPADRTDQLRDDDELLTLSEGGE